MSRDRDRSLPPSDPARPLRASVVVPTRNRPAHAAACVESILATEGFDELIVVDQSDDAATREVLSAHRDSRLRYVPSAERGVTRARNRGIEISSGDIVAFTDDDCRPRADWVRRFLDVFESDAAVAVVCGQVRVPEEIRHLGFAESFHPRGAREWQGRYPPMGQWGITANLSLRRSVVALVGAFDPMLGAGAPLKSGGEPDFLFRVLRAGHKVVNADEVVVDHLGIRQPGEESARLLRGYGVGAAAAFVKHVRLGDLSAAAVYGRFLLTATGHVGRNLISHGRPTGSGFLLALLKGAFASFRYRVDPQRRQYIE